MRGNLSEQTGGNFTERRRVRRNSMKTKSFYERVRKYRQTLTPKDELRELLDRGSDDQLRTLLTVAKGIIGRTTEVCATNLRPDEPNLRVKQMQLNG